MNKIFFQVKQIALFGFVGVMASLLHFSCVVLLVEMKWLLPLSANVVAFLISFQISYFGHRNWTFAGTKVQHKIAFIRLLLVASTSFLLNQAIFYSLLKYTSLPYWIALIIVIILVATATFLMSRMWVFR